MLSSISAVISILDYHTLSKTTDYHWSENSVKASDGNILNSYCLHFFQKIVENFIYLFFHFIGAWNGKELQIFYV